MYTINQYLTANPNASLKDWCDYVTACDEEQSKNLQDQHQKCEDWYKTLKDRYFIINFNGSSFCAVKVDKWPSNLYVNKYDCYNIYSDSNKSSIEFEHRDINRSWFNNPYENICFKNGTKGIKEITEEEFNDIANKAEQFKEILKKINLK